MGVNLSTSLFASNGPTPQSARFSMGTPCPRFVEREAEVVGGARRLGFATQDPCAHRIVKLLGITMSCTQCRILGVMCSACMARRSAVPLFLFGDAPPQLRLCSCLRLY